jgi:hypothetical protein
VVVEPPFVKDIHKSLSYSFTSRNIKLRKRIEVPVKVPRNVRLHMRENGRYDIIGAAMLREKDFDAGTSCLASFDKYELVLMRDYHPNLRPVGFLNSRRMSKR